MRQGRDAFVGRYSTLIRYILFAKEYNLIIPIVEYWLGQAQAHQDGDLLRGLESLIT